MRRRRSSLTEQMPTGDTRPYIRSRGVKWPTVLATTATLATGLGAGTAQAKDTDPRLRSNTPSSFQPDTHLFRSAAYQAPGGPLNLINILSQLTDRAKEVTGNDTTTYEYFDPVVQAQEVTRQCEFDEVTSFVPTIKGRRIKLRVKEMDGQVQTAFGHRRVVTNTPLPPGVESMLAAEVDCDLAKKEKITATPMRRTSKRSMFRAFGKAVELKLKGSTPELPDDIPLIKAPGSRPSKYTYLGELRTKTPVTATMRKRGLFGIKITQRSDSLNSGTFGPNTDSWSRVYPIRRSGKHVNVREVQFVQSSVKRSR